MARTATVLELTTTRKSSLQVQPQDDIKFIKRGCQVSSHLGFQMGLFFNVWYAPAWFGVACWALYAKYDQLDDILAVLCPVFLVFSTLIEGCRIYFGYYGNLFENPAALGAFFLLTLFLQCPLQIVQLSSYRFHQPRAEFVFDVILLAFIVAEMVTGWLAYHQIAAHTRNLYSGPESQEYKKT